MDRITEIVRVTFRNHRKEGKGRKKLNFLREEETK